eukprot:3731995-Amphidinium_carterae.1
MAAFVLKPPMILPTWGALLTRCLQCVQVQAVLQLLTKRVGQDLHAAARLRTPQSIMAAA